MDDYKHLKAEWYRKLSASGFEDIEDSKGRLKQWDRRTLAYETMEATMTHYADVEEFLNTHPELPERDRSILELYTEGKQLKDISRMLKWSYTVVKDTIRKYRELIKSRPFSIQTESTE